MAAPGAIGTKIDRYRVEALLGAGGFGAVYRARHVHTDAVVALKVLKRALGADASMVERFFREAKAAAAVGSDHIVHVLDAGQADGTTFLAMEYLEGLDLKELSDREGPLPPMRLVLATLQILEGLDAAHRKGIVHRDMKPANVFMSRRVNDAGVDRDFVKILDFGISKFRESGEQSGLTMTGVAMGTPSYMSPEQFFDARNVDGRADLYSVSAMLYHLLTGKLPFEATSYADLIVKVRTEVPPSLQYLAPQVPMPLAQAVMVGLARDKEKRWQTAREYATALRQAMALPVTSSPTPAPQRPEPTTARGPVLLDKTSTPVRPGTPAAPPQWDAPPPPPPAVPAWAPSPQSNPTPAPAPLPLARVAPSPATPQPVAASQPTPVPPGGWAAPAIPANDPPVGKSNTTTIVLVVIGVVLALGGCCVCSMFLNQANMANQQHSEYSR